MWAGLCLTFGGVWTGLYLGIWGGVARVVPIIGRGVSRPKVWAGERERRGVILDF